MFVMSNIAWIYSVIVLMSFWWALINYNIQLSWLTLSELLLSISVDTPRVDLGRMVKFLLFFGTYL